ncbi:MAG: DUF971 domain-containing protein [Magnetococcales bacterium]|nr:DUF971 domain-containing protein [Magnetococcales bacterium]MBF0151287.1 DUF971 domain-containing protein [Magnetococcales bacterium]MBF0172044.1 DUF971 domain-containing protein [Magnetococcales bacterium]MBF0630351.1 DUF971 domain-containing protein [Magnetococcales bacterium]
MSFGSQFQPTQIRQITKDRLLKITWSNGEVFDYPMEYLRVMCPCAKCSGHTPDQAQLIDGKQDVTLQSITPVGHYAVKLAFSDDHDSGLYSWDTLYELGVRQNVLWQEYLEALEKAGKRRKPSTIPIKVV